MWWEEEIFDWLDQYEQKHGAYPEDRFLRWIYHHPRCAVGSLFGIISGLPLLVGIWFGAMVF